MMVAEGSAKEVAEVAAESSSDSRNAISCLSSVGILAIVPAQNDR